MSTPPIHLFCNLSELRDAGHEAVIRPDSAALQRLAEWAGVDEVARFEARIFVRPRSRTRFAYEADLEAEIVQSCVVTLAPVRSTIARRVVRALHISPAVHQSEDRGGVLTLGVEDDVSEEIEGPNYDLAGPVLEEFALAIDPYPRAPGVTFEAPADALGRPESPFASLERLKSGR